MDFETTEPFWDVWTTRILVTVGIIAAIEFWKWHNREEPQRVPPPSRPIYQRQQQQQQQHQRQNGEAKTDTSGVVPPKPTAATTTTTTKATDSNNGDTDSNSSMNRNRLLDRLEENQKQQAEIASALVNAEETNRHPEEERNANETMKNSGKKKTEKKDKTERASAASTTSVTNNNNNNINTNTNTGPPPIKAQTNQHPGMKAFNYWMDIECSLFRIYTLGRNDDVEVAPPYVPHSYRGNVDVSLNVTNNTSTTLKVYWVDFKGNHVPKGKVKPGHVWRQTTWIDHPWVFEGEDVTATINSGEETRDVPYLYYIPYRVIPTTEDVNTLSDDDEELGLFKFEIHPPTNSSSPYLCSVKDEVMPFPSEIYYHEALPAITWTLQHMTRMMPSQNVYLVDTLQKYLTNIVEHPENVKYRQIRIASPKFNAIWQSPMRGLLFAIGFSEEGAYAELGCAHYPLSRERIQEVALLSYLVNTWKEKQLNGSSSDSQQPLGADGYGRAGFGRAGNMNIDAQRF